MAEQCIRLESSLNEYCLDTIPDDVSVSVDGKQLREDVDFCVVGNAIVFMKGCEPPSGANLKIRYV